MPYHSHDLSLADSLPPPPRSLTPSHFTSSQYLYSKYTMWTGMPPHHGSGFNGPWIENLFIKQFVDKPFEFFNGMLRLLPTSLTYINSPQSDPPIALFINTPSPHLPLQQVYCRCLCSGVMSIWPTIPQVSTHPIKTSAINATYWHTNGMTLS